MKTRPQCWRRECFLIIDWDLADFTMEITSLVLSFTLESQTTTFSPFFKESVLHIHWCQTGEYCFFTTQKARWEALILCLYKTKIISILLAIRHECWPHRKSVPTLATAGTLCHLRTSCWNSKLMKLSPELVMTVKHLIVSYCEVLPDLFRNRVQIFFPPLSYLALPLFSWS